MASSLPGVERDVVAPGIDDRPDDVEGLIAVERRNLDGDDGGYFGESAPERVASSGRPPTDGCR